LKLALITPIAQLQDTTYTNYHLLLPQLFEFPAYEKYARSISQDYAQFTILDNGAAEGEEFELDALLAMIETYNMCELVMPDILGGGRESMEKSLKAYNECKKADCSKMIVVQGTTEAECVVQCDLLMEQDPDVTIGLPRNLIQYTKDKYIRIRLASYISASDPTRDMHFLGASHLFSSEIVLAAHYLDERVRGIDTSMPYSFGQAGIRWADEMFTVDDTATRQPDFFTCELKDRQMEMSSINAMAMLEVVKRGDQTPFS
jgi:hypothetical protein